MKNKLTIALLTIFVAIIIAPPLVHGYVYPTAGDDSAYHLQVINTVSNTGTANFLYPGQAAIAYPISALHKWTGLGIDSLFLWFNYLTLIVVGIVLYFVVSRLVNHQAGLIVVPIAIFCTYSVLSHFYMGTIFNIINMCVILPLAIFFMIRWLQEFRVYQAVMSACLFSLFSVFHITSVYLLPALTLFFAVFIIYRLAKRDRVKLTGVIGFGTITVGLNLISSRLLFPSTHVLAATQTVASASVTSTAAMSITAPTSPTLSNFLSYGLGPITLTILCLSIAALVMHRKKLVLTYSSKLFVTVLACFVAVLIPAAFTNISDFSYRQALDLSSVLAIITACLAGIAITFDRTKLFTCICIVLVVCGSVPHLLSWFSYTSAIRNVDTQAIEYVNSLNGDTYSCSDTIKPHIYNRFLDKEYQEEGGDFIIYRSELMTKRVHSVQCYDKLEDCDGLLLKKFDDGEVEVYVFKND